MCLCVIAVFGGVLNVRLSRTDVLGMVRENDKVGIDTAVGG